jgi:type I restriction enzyme M protein
MTMRNETENKIWSAMNIMRSAIFLKSVDSQTIVALIGALLLLKKEGKLHLENNIKEKVGETTAQGEYVVACLDLDLLSTMAGNGVKVWQEKGIFNRCLLCRFTGNDLLDKVILDIFYKTRSLEDTYLIELVDSGNLAVDDYGQAFDSAISSLSPNRRESGEYTQPKEIGILSNRLMTGHYQNVYDPFGGLMSFAIDMDSYDHFDGAEINSRVWQLGIIRLALYGKLDKVTYVNKDMVDWPQKKYDAIVSLPPFMGRMASADGHERPIFTEEYLLSNFLDKTNDKGQMLCFVSLSILRSDRFQSLRKFLTEANVVEKIILLPENLLLNTRVQMAALFLNKEKSSPDFYFVDASDCYEGKPFVNILDVDRVIEACEPSNTNSLQISYEELKSEGWLWDVSYYKAKKAFVVPDGYRGVRLSDIAEPIHLQLADLPKDTPYVRASDLASSPYDYLLDIQKIAKRDAPTRATVVKESSLLLSTVGQLKPSWCEASEESPAYINPNIKAFRIKEKNIHMGYLCLVLSRAYVSFAGATVPHITVSSIMNIHFLLPTKKGQEGYDEQKRLFEEACDSYKLAKAKELGLLDVIDKQKTEYINQVRMRKHDMRPYVRNIKSSEKLLRYYLTHRDEELDFEKEMLNSLDDLAKSVNRLSNLLDHLSDEERFGKPELVNLDKYFHNLQDGKTYKVDYDVDDPALAEYGLPSHEQHSLEEYQDEYGNFSMEKLKADAQKEDIVPIMTTIAPSDLNRLVENIINNAVQHGFTDPENRDYSINISLTVARHNDELMYQIDFADNGKSLPEGMNKERFGLRGEKAGKTAGTGCGGYIIKSIVEHYGGDYDIFSGNGYEGTTVRIYLPITKLEDQD